MFYVFAEFESDFGRNRVSRGFTSAEARALYVAALTPCEGEEWSDFEEWEAPQEEWAHIPIIG
jgi:hypothetical protein